MDVQSRTKANAHASSSSSSLATSGTDTHQRSAFNLDTLVALSNCSFTNPGLAFLYLLWRLYGLLLPGLPGTGLNSHQTVSVSGPDHDRSCQPYQIKDSIFLFWALFVCLVYASSALGHRWRNGLWEAPKRWSTAEWKQQIVVVTGGASGMGAEMAEMFAQKGAQVVTLDVQKASHSNPRIHSYICDVSKNHNVVSVAKAIRSQLGEPTVLINNAGISNGKLICDLEERDVERMININLTSQFWTLKAFLPGMIARKRGHIVTMSSVMGYVGVAQMTDYVATKHGLVGLHESLRYELDKKYAAPHIRTTLACLGHVRTSLFSGIHFNAIARFLAPSISPESVSKAVVDALERQESTEIRLPVYVALTPALRMLPAWARDAVQWVSGADESMANLTNSS